MHCSVIIPTRLRAKLLSETLDSLGGQSEDNFEVIVVCDGEDPQTRLLAERYSAKFPIHWIFLPENLGQASARNVGAQAASGNLLLFLDDDAAPSQTWLFHHCKHHEIYRHEGGLIVCGKILESYTQPPRSYTERFLRERRDRILDSVEAHLLRQENCDCYTSCGLNTSIRRSHFLAAGGYDSKLRYVHEDQELGARLYSSGIRIVFEPLAIVYHQNTKNLEENYPQSCLFSGKSDAYRVYRKHQRNVQTKGLISLYSGSRIHCLKERVAWSRPESARRVARLFHKAVELSGSAFLFRRWNSAVASAAYWEGVRSEGITLEGLRALVGTAVPVFMFHSIGLATNEREKRIYLSPRKFARFMELLRSMKYKSITPPEFLSDEILKHNLVLTFDDGYDDFYSEVFPLLQRYDLKATVFLVVGQIGKSNAWDEAVGYRSRRLLSVEQICEMQRYGVHFGSHTLTHAWLPHLSNEDLYREVVDSKSRLEDLLGVEVLCFAYPSGGLDSRVRAAVALAGYKMAVTTEEGLNLWQDPLAVRRIGISEADTMIEFLLKLKTGHGVRLDLVTCLRRLLWRCAHPAGALTPKIPKKVISAHEWL
jgi:peptidoglycan/xylan/chitin deacetylase (PgdA/CDA1 family)/glycosyltransferase involved in cell wall biosynthesis